MILMKERNLTESNNFKVGTVNLDFFLTIYFG